MAHAHQKAFVKRQILIADDSPEWREIIEMATDGLGHHVIFADTAEQGLERTKDFPLDLAIVDVFMPGEGGIWIIEQLRESQPGVKILSVSGGWAGMTPLQALTAAKKIGADYVMSKPLSIKKLRETIQEALAA